MHALSVYDTLGKCIPQNLNYGKMCESVSLAGSYTFMGYIQSTHLRKCELAKRSCAGDYDLVSLAVANRATNVGI